MKRWACCIAISRFCYKHSNSSAWKSAVDWHSLVQACPIKSFVCCETHAFLFFVFFKNFSKHDFKLYINPTNFLVFNYKKLSFIPLSFPYWINRVNSIFAEHFFLAEHLNSNFKAWIILNLRFLTDFLAMTQKMLYSIRHPASLIDPNNKCLPRISKYNKVKCDSFPKEFSASLNARQKSFLPTTSCF